MNALLGILTTGLLWTMGMAPSASPWDPIVHLTEDYIVLGVIVSVASLICHSWRWFCKLMAFLLPNDWSLQQWFDATGQRLSQPE